jgi:peptidoglycan/xylan/chitin deacetylase (PgdA/CDA1 family)
MSQIADARTPGARRRLLVTAPFPPRLDATVGGSRVVAELVAALSTRHDLVRVGSHTRTHPRLTELGREELVRELTGSLADLDRLPYSIPVLSYPHGDHDRRVRAEGERWRHAWYRVSRGRQHARRA